MSEQAHGDVAEINGVPVERDDLISLAFSGFAHFTALQVRQRRVKGLDLHLARLRHGSLELFGKAPWDETVIAYLKSALEKAPEDCSVTITAFSQGGEFSVEHLDEAPSILVRTSDPSDGPRGPLRLAAVEHDRSMAGIKHVGEFAKTYFLHRVARRGFDDAAFIDRHGRLGEATIWNLAFWDGTDVIWPKADILIGTTMSMVRRQLERLAVPQRHEDVTLDGLAQLTGAAVLNSWTPGVPVTAIEDHQFPDSANLVRLLHDAYKSEPADAI